MRARRFAEAWDLSADALARRDLRERDNPALPYHQRWVWDGRPFDEQDVLVRCYHGFGDTIQFARFLPALADRAASVTVEMQPQLLPLFAHLREIVDLRPFDPAHPLPPAECDLEICELAFALRADPCCFPAPYLPSEWRGGGGAIGLCHAAGGWDQARDMPADLLRPLCEEQAVVLLMPGATGLPVLNPAGCPAAIVDTAALIASLDLVITVDTMVAHLAGAMGAPVWLMVKHEPDWRWDPEAEQSIWYARTRQFVQPAPGDWAAVAGRIHGELGQARDRPANAV